MIDTLLSSLFDKIFAFLRWVFDTIFGGWNYNVLFSWLPNDIQSAVSAVIVVLFMFALVHFLRSFIPS